MLYDSVKVRPAFKDFRRAPGFNPTALVLLADPQEKAVSVLEHVVSAGAGEGRGCYVHACCCLEGCEIAKG